MPELRRDPVVGRWIIVDDTDPKKPQDFHVEPHHYEDPTNCPFCYGNEYMTPPEIQTIRHEKTEFSRIIQVMIKREHQYGKVQQDERPKTGTAENNESHSHGKEQQVLPQKRD